ncbi:MAG TPA: HD-GYP domain-containing protein [Bacilli bacterium]|nr:HD-GYP domain-containing protein [Bacilli bacterium]
MANKRSIYGIGGVAVGVLAGLLEWNLYEQVEPSRLIWMLALQGGVGLLLGVGLYRLQQDIADRRLRTTYGTLNALARAVAAKDNETNGHSRRVVQYSLLIGRRMELEADTLQQLEWGALLHDIGKIAVPDAVLQKSGPLSDEEWGMMKQHPQIGYQMVQDLDFLDSGLDVVLYHHERFDGGGYPQRLQGESVPLLARIFAIADTFDAITSDRPYRKAQSAEHAREEIRRHVGRQFCPRCVEAFFAIPIEELEAVKRESQAAEPEIVTLLEIKQIS